MNAMASAEAPPPPASTIDSQQPEDSASASGREHIRGSSLFLVGNLISLAITFLPHLALVRYLSTETYAHLAYALSFVAVLKTYALGFNEALSRFVPLFSARRQHARMLGCVVVVFSATLLVSGVMLTVFAAGHDAILRMLTKGREPAALLLILMFLIPLEATEVLILNLFACFSRIYEVFWGRYIIPPLLRAAIVVWLIVRHNSVQFLAVGYVAVEVITITTFAVVGGVLLSRRGARRRHFVVHMPTREVLSFSLPLMASNVVGMMGNSIPIMLLGYFQPMSSVAYYRVVLPAAMLATAIPGNFLPLYIPAAARLFAKGDIDGINKLFWETSVWMTVLALPMFLAMFCFSHSMTTFLYGARYSSSAPILSMMALAYFLSATFAFNGSTLKVLGKVREMVIINLLAPLGIVVFDLLLIPRYGALGAAIGTASGILFQIALRQIGLWMSTERLHFFDKNCIPPFAIIAGTTGTLYVLQRILHLNAYAAIACVIPAWIATVWLIKKHLRVASMFPEIARIPLVGRIFA